MNDLSEKILYGDLYNELHNSTIKEKIIEVGNNFIPIKFECISDLYYLKMSIKGKFAIIFVFNIGDSESLDDLISNFASARNEYKDSDLISIIAADGGELREKGKENLIPYEKLEEIERELNTKVMEISSETGENVSELFYLIKNKISEKKHQMRPKRRRKKEEEKKKKKE